MRDSGREGINLPHGHLKTLAALGYTTHTTYALQSILYAVKTMTDMQK